jgi:hypothetical protein
MTGTPLVVRTYHRETLPFCAFPCDAQLHDVRRVRRLELRVHARARLIFEASSSSSTTPPVRGVRLEVDVGGAWDEDDDDDLRRTVENTIQNVMLRMRPTHKAFVVVAAVPRRPTQFVSTR